MEEMHIRNYAYLGDAVWELYIREQTVLITEHSKELHKLTTERVKASNQAMLLRGLEEILTDMERDIARRARNLPVPVARRSNQSEYRQATAFEALIGWWYKVDKRRLEEIFMKLVEFELNKI